MCSSDLTGAFEFQDEASQLVALLCAAKRGERVLDIAAGAGGKSLALAAAMNNEGEILACDVDIARLRALGPRARRAGVTIIRTQGLDDAPLEPIFDVVLVDAPCSGSGTWRRNPETKWRLTSERLGELTQIQRALLERAANAVRPGGRLVYSVCSLFPSEGQDQVDNFLASRPAFRLDPVESAWDKAGSGTRPPGLGKVLSTSPARTGTDGFFAGVMVRGDKITMV